MKVLVTRQRQDGQRFAAMLADAGHAAMFSPVITIEPTGRALPQGPFDGVVATSANAFAGLVPAGPEITGLPLFAVGEHTAAVAREHGFGVTGHVAADAAGLAGHLAQYRKALPRLLYLAGEDRKPLLERQLCDAGFDLTVVITYRAVAVEAFAPEIMTALGNGELDAVTHFSRRSAKLFCNLAAKAGLEGEARKLVHVCLSADVAAGLESLAPPRILIAPQSDAPAMVATLANAAR